MTIATRAPVIMPEHGDPEQDKQPADDPPAGRGHERRVALAEDGGDRPS